VLVPGDVNSTVGAALVAAKLDIPVAHIEAVLSSFDRSMPEEINRLLTDQLSNLVFTHSPEARDNLLREGIDAARIHAVGNAIIDKLGRLASPGACPRRTCCSRARAWRLPRRDAPPAGPRRRGPASVVIR
jgi:UDP-N-acetylglucosamine 2-epimerase (non-hydrolysing)